MIVVETNVLFFYEAKAMTTLKTSKKCPSKQAVQYSPVLYCSGRTRKETRKLCVVR
jgi:hypothetical protein